MPRYTGRMTVFVATYGMHYEVDALVAVCATLVGAQAALEAHVRSVLSGEALPLAWERSACGKGTYATIWDNYTATVVEIEVTP